VVTLAADPAEGFFSAKKNHPAQCQQSKSKAATVTEVLEDDERQRRC